MPVVGRYTVRAGLIALEPPTPGSKPERGAGISPGCPQAMEKVRKEAVPRAGRRTKNDEVTVAVAVHVRPERYIAVGAKRDR